ncbi:MAG TPA: Fur family transcriptional regulator [Acetobacteraceae bacterium]|nr:Fur family transcriptional regulator [Acetobacteraceae bacterium]
MPKLEDATTAQLDRAAAACARRGTKLTEIRRLVLALIIEHRAPIGAYALLDRLKAKRTNAAPVTVYRALDFLVEHGLIHKIERLSAFVACTEQGEHPNHEHAVQFLICRKCGTVSEMEDPGIARAVSRAAGQTGFHPDHATVEVEGTCGNCSASL